jgi:ABC-2 type transport system permease protein
MMISRKRLHLYWHVWSKLAEYALAETFINRWANVLFMLGKVLRFGMLLFFLFVIQQSVQDFNGYTPEQVVVFFLTYQFLDTLAQVFYRGVYLFSWQVKSGELDFYLSKPLHPLFRILTGKPDFIDVFFFIPTTLLSVYLMREFFFAAPPLTVLAYILLLINGFFIATAFHILIISLGVVTVEVDNAVMLYRDINTMSRFPVTIYHETLRTILLFAVPVGLMNTVPAQVLLQSNPTVQIWATLIIGTTFLAFSIKVWNWSIKRYTGAGG